MWCLEDVFKDLDLCFIYINIGTHLEIPILPEQMELWSTFWPCGFVCVCVRECALEME